MPAKRKRNPPATPTGEAASGPAASAAAPAYTVPPEVVGDWRLPSEIRRFFRTRTAQSIQIRGAPGTGKTTFALSVLAGLPIPAFYVSTRVLYPELLEHFPWLTDRIPEDHVVDAERLWPGVDGKRDYGQLIRKYTRLAPDSEEFGELDRFLTLPTGVQEVFSRFRRDERSAVVIDSWDGLIEPYLGHPSEEPTNAYRFRIENALVSALTRSNVHAILVRESPAPSALEYLVHGVVELRRTDYEGMVLRELVFHKLRGVPLQSTSVLFSLEGGRFTTIPRSNPRSEFFPEARFEARENPTDGLSWGVAELDRAFGPLRSGQAVLIELGPEVDHRYVRPLTFHVYAQALRSGWEVSVLPDGMTPLTTIIREMETMVEPELLRDRFSTIASPAPVRQGEPTPPATRQLVERLRDSLSSRTVNRVSLNAVASAFGTISEFIDAVTVLASREHDRGGLLLMTAPTGTPAIGEISSLVQVHLRVALSNRTVLIYGVRPSSAALGLLANLQRGEYPAMSLIPIR